MPKDKNSRIPDSNKQYLSYTLPFPMNSHEKDVMSSEKCHVRDVMSRERCHVSEHTPVAFDQHCEETQGS